MSEHLDVYVVGIAGSKGSRNPMVSPKGRPYHIESDKKVPAWAEAVKAAAIAVLDAGGPAFRAGPVMVTIVFRIPRPNSHYRSSKGQTTDQLKPDAPYYVAVKPDLDKLTRSTLDALKVAGVYNDDGQVALLPTIKRYTNTGERPGAAIRVRAATREDPTP